MAAWSRGRLCIVLPHEPEKIFVTRYTRNENIPIGTAELTAFLRILQLFGQFFPLKCHQLNFEELEDVFNSADGFKLQTPRNEKFRPFYEKTEIGIICVLSLPQRDISFDLAEYTADVDGVGTLRLLDAVKTCGLINSVKFYQASTSELYGKVQEIPQKETTPFYPRSPYGAAKLYAYWIVVNFREAYNLFAVNGILFNHESPRRGANFVTRKISRSVAKIYLGQLECFSLGNLDAKRDWGHAKDYVEVVYTRDVYTRVTYTQDVYTRVMRIWDVYTQVIYTRVVHTWDVYTQNVYTWDVYTQNVYTWDVYTWVVYTPVMCTWDVYTQPGRVHRLMPTWDVCTWDVYTRVMYTRVMYTQDMYTWDVLTRVVYTRDVYTWGEQVSSCPPASRVRQRRTCVFTTGRPKWAAASVTYPEQSWGVCIPARESVPPRTVKCKECKHVSSQPQGERLSNRWGSLAPYENFPANFHYQARVHPNAFLLIESSGFRSRVTSTPVGTRNNRSGSQVVTSCWNVCCVCYSLTEPDILKDTLYVKLRRERS
ncbi:hypothetical protein EI555_021638 [Monodon monoceros]|uniref:GDP-mannose 4,6-dehydratase n=1 Tax=Monodon monoceros TaxID=40151 RepID=A0A4U1EP70_MONMO|nr:hypothetical protein EI555_021638 [Monodon monoceros]